LDACTGSFADSLLPGLEPLVSLFKLSVIFDGCEGSPWNQKRHICACQDHLHVVVIACEPTARKLLAIVEEGLMDPWSGSCSGQYSDPEASTSPSVLLANAFVDTDATSCGRCSTLPQPPRRLPSRSLRMVLHLFPPRLLTLFLV
jgi:hypothetical protein